VAFGLSMEEIKGGTGNFYRKKKQNENSTPTRWFIFGMAHV
jgi:hypothetical protein